MEKLDLVKENKSYYTAKLKPELVEIEKAQFLSITGKGDPSAQLFLQKIQALYATAYTIKFAFKAKHKDFTVAKLEGLWWFDTSRYKNHSITDAPREVPRSEWEYRLLLRMPGFITQKDVQAAIQSMLIKKKLEYVRDIELHEMYEGTCVQMLHTGPFSNEPETLKHMQDFMLANRLIRNGLHHEIYLSDFNRTSPDKLNTILRERVRPGP